MASMIDIYIGRQPIFKQDLSLYAYELLFRTNQESNYANMVSGDSASAQVMLHAFGDMGLKDIAGNNKVFINFTEGLLLRENQPFFPPNQVVIEVLEDVEVTEPLLRAIKELRTLGYTIALDDYVFNPQLERLEAYADLIKVDILEVGPKLLNEHVKRLKAKGVRLLAEKVELREQYEFCKKIGFDYFQGYFFAKPKIIKGQRLPTNKLTVIQLLANVYDPDIDMRRLSEIISNDVSLSQKLLKFLAENVNSKVPINSIHDGVVRFGLTRLQSWISMLALSGLDDKPIELFRMALTRAKFCELVGTKIGDFKPDIYFTVGLFSTLDAVMDTPLTELLSKLNLDSNIVNALIGEPQNNLKLTLETAKSFERGHTDFTLPERLFPTELSHTYLEAMQFAQDVFKS
jgi:EAL and modified HD-GYP domain-containing signal transduction protein